MTLSTRFIPIPNMDATTKSSISQFWKYLQNILFPFLREEEYFESTPMLEKVVRVLEFVQIDHFIPSSKGCVGRPQKDRVAIARAFVAKAVLNLGTTEMLIDRLKVDKALRRICGFEQVRQVPDASRFSRAFADFAALQLPARVHEALICSQLHGHVMGHSALDATAIDGNEKPIPKAPTAKAIESAITTEVVAAANPIQNSEFVTTTDQVPVTESATSMNIVVVTESIAIIKPVATIDSAAKLSKSKGGRPPKNAAASIGKPAKKKCGRPPKLKEQPIDLTRIERQVGQSIAQALAELPTTCDVGCKKNSKGHIESWVGYKLHIETVDGDIPVAAVLTSASVHDSQVAIPLMRIAGERVIYFYDLADAAYCSGVIREESHRLGHVPLIDHNPRRSEKIEFLPHEAQRYKTRSQAERVNSMLKENHGGNHVRVKGATKVYAHLMFGILVISAEQILRLIQ